MSTKLPKLLITDEMVWPVADAIAEWLDDYDDDGTATITCHAKAIEFLELAVAGIDVSQFVAALIAEGGRVSYAKSAEAWRGWVVQGSEPEPGRYLVYGPIPVESAEAKETP